MSVSTDNTTATDYSQSTTQKRAAEAKTSQFGTSTQDFLQLLVAQLVNQDPLNPMEDMDFTSQLAQLQSLQEQVAMTKSMNAMRMDSQFQSATNLIGKEVTGLDKDGKEHTGVVVKVSQTSDDVFVELGDGTKLSVSNVTNIVGGMSSVSGDVASSTAAIGKFVEAGKDSSGNAIRGIVQSVAVVDGQVQLKLYGGSSITWDEVTNVRPVESTQADEVYYFPDNIRVDYVKAYNMLNKVVTGTDTKGNPVTGMVADAEITAEGKVNLVLFDGSRVEVNKVTSTPADPTAKDIEDNLKDLWAVGYDKDGVKTTGKIIGAEDRDGGVVIKLEGGKEIFWDTLEELHDKNPDEEETKTP